MDLEEIPRMIHESGPSPVVRDLVIARQREKRALLALGCRGLPGAEEAHHAVRRCPGGRVGIEQQAFAAVRRPK